MLNTKGSDGVGAFLTPLVMKGSGKDAVNVNVIAGGSFALGLAYLAKCAIETSDSDNRYNNLTVRKNASDVVKALSSTGKPEDVFSFLDPTKWENREAYGSPELWTPIYSVTRGELLKVANAVLKVDEILSKAEIETKKIALSVNPTVTKIREEIVYFEGVSKGKGKKKGAVISI